MQRQPGSSSIAYSIEKDNIGFGFQLFHIQLNFFLRIDWQVESASSANESFPFVLPQLSRCMLFAPPEARAISLHNDLLCNDTPDLAHSEFQRCIIDSQL